MRVLAPAFFDLIKQTFHTTNHKVSTPCCNDRVVSTASQISHNNRDKKTMMMRLLKGIYLAALPCTVSSWTMPSVRPRGRHPLKSSSSSDAEGLREQAQRLRQEIDSLEEQKASAAQDELRQIQEEQAVAQQVRDRYSATVPILKPDGSTVEERCDFVPQWRQEENTLSFITVIESALPIGVILGESEEIAGATVVDELGENSNGQMAGLQVGDIVRAFTACRMEMDRPAWQLMAGGIGRPKTVRFMYSADNRPFEEVMEAVASNRMDPQQRPVLMVVERREEEQ